MDHRKERDLSAEICQPFFWEGEKHNGKIHGVLLLHGFTGTVAHMRMLGESLHKQDFAVMGINLPGHGTNMDDMARRTWDEWLIAAKEAFLQLKAKCDYVSVAGLSMGGCLTLLLAEQLQPTAIAPISAPMGTKAPLWAARLLSPFLKTIWWKKRDGNPDLVDNEYDCGYSGFRATCAVHLSRLIKMARRDLHAVTCPVLVVQTHADDTITPDSADVILGGVSSEVKRVLWLEEVPHVCTISKEAERMAEAIGAHFRSAEN